MPHDRGEGFFPLYHRTMATTTPNSFLMCSKTRPVLNVGGNNHLLDQFDNAMMPPANVHCAGGGNDAR